MNVAATIPQAGTSAIGVMSNQSPIPCVLTAIQRCRLIGRGHEGVFAVTKTLKARWGVCV